MVQVVTGYYFVLYALVVKANCVVCVVASKLKQVLYYELLVLTPPDFQACLVRFVVNAFNCFCVKKIENFLIVYL